jgi:hypothetical protein
MTGTILSWFSEVFVADFTQVGEFDIVRAFIQPLDYAADGFYSGDIFTCLID